MPSSAISSLLSHVLQPCEHIQKNQPYDPLAAARFVGAAICPSSPLHVSMRFPPFAIFVFPLVIMLFLVGSVFNSDYQKAIQQYKYLMVLWLDSYRKDKFDSNYRVICHYVSLFKAIPSGYWTDDIMIQFLNQYLLFVFCEHRFLDWSTTTSLYHYIKKNEELPGLFSNLFQFISVRHSDLLSRYITTLFKEKEKYINTFFALLSISCHPSSISIDSETLSNLAVYHVDQLLHDQGIVLILLLIS